MVKKKNHKQLTKRTSSLVKQNRLFTILLCLAVISIIANIVQFSLSSTLNNKLSDVSEKLSNYRSLQDKQIQAVRTACKQLKTDVLSSGNKRSTVAMGLALATKLEAPTEHYRSEVLDMCHSPLFFISGVRFDGDVYSWKEAVIEGNSNFDIKSNAFDGVKW